MRRLNLWKMVVPLGALVIGLGAAPAAPDYHNVQRTIDEIRADWAKPGAGQQPNAPGWNAFFDALLNEFRTYAAARDENERLASLNRLYQYSRALGAVGWRPAAGLHEELRAWLRPRVRLAWAERRLVDSVRGLRASADGGVNENRTRWIKFVDDDLGAALRQYSGGDDRAPAARGAEAGLRRPECAGGGQPEAAVGPLDRARGGAERPVQRAQPRRLGRRGDGRAGAGQRRRPDGADLPQGVRLAGHGRAQDGLRPAPQQRRHRLLQQPARDERHADHRLPEPVGVRTAGAAAPPSSTSSRRPRRTPPR